VQEDTIPDMKGGGNFPGGRAAGKAKQALKVITSISSAKKEGKSIAKNTCLQQSGTQMAYSG